LVAVFLVIGAGMYLRWQYLKPPKTRPGAWAEETAMPTGAVDARTAHHRLGTTRETAPPVPAQPPERLTVYNSVALVPTWAVPFGGEFWRRPTLQNDDAMQARDGSVVHNAPFSVGDVIERVTHALEVDSVSGLPQ